MDDQVCSAIEAAVESAIEKVVQDFQRDPNHVWNEVEILSLLFHYLQMEKDITQEYPSQLIRAEFPTTKVLKESGKRSYYDLVVLDSGSYTSLKYKDAEAQAPRNIKIGAAVEIRLWSEGCSSEEITERINRDVDKLTEHENGVQYAYFINLVQLPYENVYREFYRDLRENLGNINHANLKILCAPADQRFEENNG
jgi:hypothetical protein